MGRWNIFLWRVHSHSQCGQVIGRTFCFQNFKQLWSVWWAPSSTSSVLEPPLSWCRIPPWMARNHMLFFPKELPFPPLSLVVSHCLSPLGCYTRLSQSGRLMNNRSLFSQFCRLGSPRSRCQPIQPTYESPLVVSSRSGRGEGTQGVLYWGANAILEESDHLSEVPAPDTIVLGTGFQHKSFGIGGTQAVSLQQPVCRTAWLTLMPVSCLTLSWSGFPRQIFE